MAGIACSQCKTFVQDWREASSSLVFCSSPKPLVCSPFQAAAVALGQPTSIPVLGLRGSFSGVQ